MQKYLYLIIISFSFTGCYTYQVKKQTATVTDNKQESKKASVLADNNSMQAKSIPAESLPLPRLISRRNLPLIRMSKLTLMANPIK